MSVPGARGLRRPRTLRLLLSLTLLALSLSLVLSATVGTPEATAADAAARRSFTPKQIPWSRAELANSLRGQYSWLGQAAQPSSYPAPDTYYRDQVRWGQIEPTRGQYDFGWFENGLADAESKHGTFGFRVMAWCPGCWTEDPDRAVRRTTPAWLPLQAGTSVPDWNSEAFLTAWDDLMAALADRYAADPRLGWVDVGGYGRYGEWHVDGEGTPATAATKRRIIESVAAHFPTKPVVVNAMDLEGINQALDVSPRVGFRMDCLGKKGFFRVFDTIPALRDRWKTAPVMTEWCHAPDTRAVTGADQVAAYHVSTVSSGNFPIPYTSMSTKERTGWRSAVKHSGYRYQLRRLDVPRTVRTGRAFSVGLRLGNVGSAPTYHPWQTELRLLDADGETVSTTKLNTDLRTLLPGARTYLRTAAVAVPPGRYRIGIGVVDPDGYLPPMRLGTYGLVRGGTYVAGSITVTR